MGPHSLQSGQQVLQLRQFDLHPGFAGASSNSEDVEYELRAIQNANTDAILEGFSLCRCELVVEDYEIRIANGHRLPELIDLALSDVKAWMGGIDPLADDVDDLPTGGIGQPGQLLEMFLSNALGEAFQGSPDEYRPIHAYAVADQLGRNVAS